MVDSCHLNSTDCLNNGKCAFNNSLNTTYCQCDSCYYGLFCENEVWRQIQFNANLVYLIIYIIILVISILNNSLALELFIRCKQIRGTNCGTYLIVYAILSLISSIFLVADGVTTYYPNLLGRSENRPIFDCYISKIGYNMLIHLCIWFSACVVFERGLVIGYGSKTNTNRWRSIVTIIVLFTVGGGSATPLLVYKCDWDAIPKLLIVREFFLWFYSIVGILIYVVATILVLAGFARRIRKYGTQGDSFLKTYLKLLRSHLFIFIPPITYAVSFISYTIVTYLQNPKHAYLQCGISTGEYITKVLLETQTHIPVVITWLLFVYPSKVYMTEFCLETWSGKCYARILLFLRSFID